jgi:rhamnosyltransferase
MTSGSMIRLSAYKKIGGFLEKFFIDYVDNEFCLRMILAGYYVMQLNSVTIYHKLGSTQRREFIYRKVFPTNHPPLRLYYRTRNRFYVYNKYKNQFIGYILFDIRVFIKDFIKILLYENNRLKKIKMIIKGYKDYKNDKFGKFKE